MKIRAKVALSAASMLIVAAGAAGCGGGDSGGDDTAKDAPAAASKGDFCDAFATFQTNLASVDPTGDPKAVVAKFKSEAKKLQDTGTPDDISDTERSGYTAVLDAIQGLPDDASLDDLSKLDDGLSATDKKNGEAFETYLEKECPDLGGDSSSDSSSQ